MTHERIAGLCGVGAWLGLSLLAAPAQGQQPGGNYNGPQNGHYNQGYANPSFDRGGSGGPWQTFGNPYENRQGNMGRAFGQSGFNPDYASMRNGYDSFGYGGTHNGNDGGTRQAFDRAYHEGFMRGYHEAMNHASMQAGPAHSGAAKDFRHVQVAGALEQTKKVQLPGMEQPLLVGELTTANGRQVLVGFGPNAAVEKLNLKPGERITVHGLLCQRSQPAMLLAEHVRTGSKRLTIEAFEGVEPERMRVQGKLEKLQKLQLPGTRSTMLVGLVKDKQGQCVIVNFGSSDQAGDLDLQEGADVRVRGDGFDVGEQQVLFANHVRANGHTVSLGD